MGYHGSQVLSSASLTEKNITASVLPNIEAGYRALNQANHEASIEFYNHAINTLDGLPTAEKQLGQIIDVHLQVLRPYIIRGDLDIAKHLINKTLTLATKAKDIDSVVKTKLLLMLYYWIKGDFNNCIELGEKILKTPNLDYSHQIPALSRISGVYFDLGLFTKSAILCKQNLGKIFKNNGRFEQYGLLTIAAIQPYIHLASICGFQGNFQQAYKYASQSWAIAAECNHPFSQAYSNSRLGSIYVHQGRFAEGLDLLEKNRKFCVFSKNRLFGPYIAIIPYAKARLGDIDGALKEFRETFDFEHQKSIEKSYFRQIWGWYAETLLLAKNYSAALQVCNNALLNAENMGERYNQAWLYRLKADILLASSDSVDSEYVTNLINQSLLRCKQENLRPSQAHCYVTLGHLHQKLGQLRKAKMFFSVAAHFFAKMAMFFYENSAVNLSCELVIE
jgi:tetratricopeptide (TPR) repeat protein